MPFEAHDALGINQHRVRNTFHSESDRGALLRVNGYGVFDPRLSHLADRLLTLVGEPDHHQSVFESAVERV